jgi:hypothetical protein
VKSHGVNDFVSLKHGEDRSRDSRVGVMTGCRLAAQVQFQTVLLSSLQAQHRLWVPTSLLSNGYWGLFPQDRAAGEEADHSLP